MPNRFLRTAIVLIILSVVTAHLYARFQFARAYDAYRDVARTHAEAALIPALPQNPLRQDLNRALSESLAELASPESRREAANEGLTLLILAEGAIDAIGEVGKDVTRESERMAYWAESPLNWPARGVFRDVVNLAGERAEHIADIRGLTYRANFHTKEIFEQIIEDNGEVTAAHASQLERLIPSVEEQFDLRSNKYAELQKLGTDLEAVIDEVWLPPVFNGR